MGRSVRAAAVAVLMVLVSPVCHANQSTRGSTASTEATQPFEACLGQPLKDTRIKCELKVGTLAALPPDPDMKQGYSDSTGTDLILELKDGQQISIAGFADGERVDTILEVRGIQHLPSRFSLVTWEL